MAISSSNGHYIYSDLWPSSYGWDHHVEWTEVSTSTANNTSTIEFTAYLRSTGASFTSADTGGQNNWLSIYWFDDNSYTNGVRVNIAEKILSIGINGKYTLTGRLTVPHKANGTLTGYARSYWTKGDNNSGTPNSGEINTASKALTAIPRGSSITVFNAFTIEDGFSFTYKDALANKTLTLTCKLGTTTLLTKTYTSVIGNHTDTITFTQAQLETIYSNIGSTNKSATFTLTMTTGGITGSSTATATGTLSLADNAPYLEDTLAIAEVGALTTLGVADNVVMRYISTKVITAEASARHGATIRSVTVTNGNVTANTTLNTAGKYVSAQMTNLTSGSFWVTATDSRGYIATRELRCTFYEYSYPTITDGTLARTSNITDSGTATASGTFWNNVPYTPTAQTTVSLTVSFTIGADTWTTTYAGIPVNTSNSWTTEQALPTGTLLRENAYTCTITVTDMYGQSASYETSVGVARRALWLGKYTVRAEGIVTDHAIVNSEITINDPNDSNNSVTLDADGGLKTAVFTSASQTCGANSTNSSALQITVTPPTGYKFVAVLQTFSNGAVVPCYCTSRLPSSSGTVSVWWRNPTSSSLTATFSVICLFIRT